MKSGSWSSFQSALPFEARAGGEPDDGAPPPGRHDGEGPACLSVCYWTEIIVEDDVPGRFVPMSAPVGRWFPAEAWAWKHAVAWLEAMKKRHGHAWIEEHF